MFFVGFISDDEALRHVLSEQLKQDNQWQHTAFTSLEDAVAAWSDALPPVIVWDAQTAKAKEDMLDFFAMRLEDKQPHPILIIVGEAPASFKAQLCTEEISRPLRLGYLLARLQFYQRLLQQAPDVTWALGPWLFEPRSHRLVLRESGDVVKLTDKEVAVLEYLYAAQDPVPREELLASVWGYDSKMDTHTVETHIYRLRKKLMDDQNQPKDVFTTEGRGYQIDPSWRGDSKA